jgi:hypothetical protein
MNQISDPDQTTGLPGPECPEVSMTKTQLTAFLPLPLLAALIAGCDPASAEYGTVEIASDTPTLTEEILKPPGVEVPPRLAKKAVQPPTGPTAVIPSKK